MTLEEATAKIEALEKSFAEEREALKRKNDELIGEKRKVQERLRELEEGDATRKMKEMEAELEALKKGGNTEELQAAYEKRLADAQAAHDQRLAELEQAKKEAESRANNMIAERDLTAAISELKLADGSSAKILKTYFQAHGLEVNTSGDTPYAMIQGRKISDWVSDWEKTDEAKHFLRAPGNGGGGGSEPNPSAAPTGKKWDDMSLSEQTALYKSDPDAAAAAQKKAA